jgi:hypothetical protein
VPDIRDEDDARARVNSLILSGERILWIGRPDPAVNFTLADAYLIPFSLLWFGFVAIWNIGVGTSPNAQLFSAVGVFFLVAGVYVVFGRFVYKRLNKLRTVYAITTHRALVLTGARKVTEIPASGQPITTRIARNGKHMTVTFGMQRTGLFSQRNNYPNTGLEVMAFLTPQPVAFYDVVDVDGLQAALAKSREKPTERIPHA